MDLLRFTTAGSVDDGKSTLIGRLLYDTKSILQDQYEAIERSSARRGKNGVDLALLTDGLRAEREQGITIDVAYRYFSTPKRAFVISDTPGHEQYTRNMVTGASGAELAIILIDARNGVMTQSRRHGFIASLLQIPHFVVAVNKMDLVDFSEARFEEIRREFAQFVGRLNVDSVTFIPISALDGDNVVEPSERTPWYDGATLLHHLETVKVGAARNTVDFRMPVQLVARPNQDFRGFSGEIESGSVSVGEDVLVLPARTASKVARIVTFDGDLERAQAGMPVTLTLEDEIDASRGDMIVRARNVPRLVHRLDADVCWMSETPMKLGTSYIIRHTTRTAQAAVDTIIYRTNVNTLHREEAATLKLNEIGRVELDVSVPLAIDPYRINRRTGCFVLVDPATNATVAAGMIRGEGQDVPAVDEPYEESSRPHVSPNVTWEG
ncbi:MAG: sulfate adenylyltransferase subunit CysN, partial [Bacteroidota bacterium]